MAIRMEYQVTKLPDTYVTSKIVYSYETDPDWQPHPNMPNQRPLKIRKETVVEERGGWLFTFMRGHQIRVTTPEQLKILGLSAHSRLIDDTSGLEVNRDGIPLDVANHVRTTPLMDGGGNGDTVESLMGGTHSPVSDDPIADIIKETE